MNCSNLQIIQLKLIERLKASHCNVEVDLTFSFRKRFNLLFLSAIQTTTTLNSGQGSPPNPHHKLNSNKNSNSTLDFDTARTIATSLVHSKLDYCNSLYYNLPHTQIGRLQVIQNALARAVTNTPKFVHITPILKSLHWLKINQRMEYKIISLTYTATTPTTRTTLPFR